MITLSLSYLQVKYEAQLYENKSIENDCDKHLPPLEASSKRNI